MSSAGGRRRSLLANAIESIGTTPAPTSVAEVADAEALTRAVSDLTAPDQAAALAGSAWAVSTGGAAVLRRIADTVIAAMERDA